MSLHYNSSDRFLCDDSMKIYNFKSINFEIKPYPLRFENISNNFTVDNMKKTGLKRKAYNFSSSRETIDTTDVVDIHRHLMKKHNIVWMPRIIKQNVFVLVMVLASFDGSATIICVSMNNQTCMVRPTLINLNPD